MKFDVKSLHMPNITIVRRCQHIASLHRNIRYPNHEFPAERQIKTTISGSFEAMDNNNPRLRQDYLRISQVSIQECLPVCVN